MKRPRRKPDNPKRRRQQDEATTPPTSSPDGGTGHTSHQLGRAAHVQPPPDVALHDYLAVLPNNPMPPLDRRWQVVELAAHGFMPWTADQQDAWIQKGTTYLRTLKPGTDAGRAKLVAELPDIDAAYKIHCGDKLTRGILEARVLTGLPVEQVAAACGLTAESVRAYEALFFNVRDGLAIPAYVMTMAIGTKLHHGLTAEDVDIILKHVGYYYGPVLLGWLVGFYTSGLVVPDSLQSASQQDLQMLVHMLSAQALHLAYVLPFVGCFRALRLKALADELQTYVDSLSRVKDNDRLRTPLGVGSGNLNEVLASPEKPKSAVDDPEWWSAWRAALRAAQGGAVTKE